MKPCSMWNHWVARASGGYEPFKEFESAQWTWNHLSKVFPELLFSVLMPNHVHLILPRKTPLVSQRLGGFLGVISKRERIERLWQRIPEPKRILDRFHLRRQVRYVALNPCRKNLAMDPLNWYWCTYRDVMGTTAEGRGSAERLISAFDESPRNFRVRFHAYVSGDPSVKVEGTPFPHAAMPKNFAEISIGEILAASAAALRMQPGAVQKVGPLRSLFVHQAYRHGWQQASLLAAICGMSRGGVYRIIHQGAPSGVEAADLCLGDSRLRCVGSLSGLKVRCGSKISKLKGVTSQS